MKKRTLGILIAILGIAMLFTSFYIKGQVKEGRQQIAEGQAKVDTGSKLFSFSPTTKEVGKGLTKEAQRKIDEGKMKADKYDTFSLWLKIGGVVFIVLGSTLIYVYRKQ